MVKTQFGALLKEFENFFNCSLEPDENDSCVVKMGVGVTLQIELDRYGFILIGCRLGALQMGRFRDNIMRAALQSNEATLPSTGVLGFSHKSLQLILFMKLNPHLVSIHQILSLMPPFVTKAKQWTDAIAKGEVPKITSETSSKVPSGLFGLIS
jgi:hypothetical protein